MRNQVIRTGFVGAGYISKWHAQAIGQLPNVKLVAVCDRSESAARGLAEPHGAKAFTSLDEMIAANECDAVHLLTPPVTHHPIALQCIAAGLHVLIEKPFAVSVQECEEISEASEAHRVVAAVGHNFLCLKSFDRLKQMFDEGGLGSVSSLDVNWCLPFEPLRSGPFGIWPLQRSGNLLLELGPHALAFVDALVGELRDVDLRLGKPIDVPGCGTHYQSWQVLGRAQNDIDVRVQLSLAEVIDDRSVTILGSSARARLDYAADVLVVERQNASDIVLNDFQKQMSAAKQSLHYGVGNAMRQFMSFNQKSAYAAGFIESAHAFYHAVARGEPIDDRISARSAVRVMKAAEAIKQLVPGTDVVSLRPFSTAALPPSRSELKPAMVIGGTGFLGRDLVRGLVEEGYRVKVVSRGRSSIFDAYGDAVEFVTASLKDRVSLAAAMQDVGVVYNLARALGRSWDDCLENDLKPTLAIAEACVDADVDRLVYTGTIASYDMSDPSRDITEAMGFAQDMSDRNLYARSKAHCEAQLRAYAATNNLDLVIVRPGIVLGAGGPLQHWGIGRWHGSGAVRIWGKGRNLLPLVLVGDVTDGLIAAGERPESVGQSFNLVGDVRLTAREYFDEIHRRTGVRIDVRPSSLSGMYLSGS
ncbi:MAG: NAD-dependent epimerase/dehydratase family protein, partial [Pseudomonadota bacterium]